MLNEAKGRGMTKLRIAKEARKFGDDRSIETIIDFAYQMCKITREETLEECAQLADRTHSYEYIGDRIRWLKET